MSEKAPLLLGLSSTVLNVKEEARLRSINPKGIILFRRNYENTSQIKQLIQTVKEILGKDTIIAVDHEGGSVIRFPEGLPHLPSPVALGDKGNSEKVFQLSRETAFALSELGINLNLAPVLDLATVQTHSSLRKRCFGSDPKLVAEMGVAFIEGMHDGNLKCTAKHFPGLGPGRHDTHELGISITLTKEEFKHHWHPFSQAITAGVDAILISHAIYPTLDHDQPATFSQKIIRGILQKKLDFSGIIISDDLEMGAISRHYSIEEAVQKCLLAGCTIASVCHDTRMHWKT